MSFDLDIIVLKQKEPVLLDFKSLIDVKNEVADNVMRLDYTWLFMAQTDGIYYSLVKKDDNIQNAFLICESDFEVDEQNIEMPYWIEDEDVKYNLTPLIIREKYKFDFERILRFLLSKSPIKTILFLAKYQGGDREVICGVITTNEFFKLLNERKILFNTCYIIRDN